MELFWLLKQCGPTILVVAYLFWDGWVRQTRMTKHIANLESEYHQRGLDEWPFSRLRPPRRGDDSGADCGGWRPG
jgi:hypothetical protein